MKEYLKNLRKLVGPIPILVCGASVIVENDRSEILLILRSDNKCWAYPGGSVDIDEVVEAAAKRELREETGIIAASLDLFGVFSGKDLHYIYPHGDEISNVDVVYICKSYSGEAKADLVESDEVKFFPLDHLPDNLSAPCVPALHAYKKAKRAEA